MRETYGGLAPTILILVPPPKYFNVTVVIIE